jgi:cytochrome c oxidase assembly protein subunit 15
LFTLKYKKQCTPLYQAFLYLYFPKKTFNIPPLCYDMAVIMKEGQQRAMQNLSKFTGYTALLTYILIVLGAAVRVFDAGMSCPDWPMCYGEAIPFPVDPIHGYSNFQVFLEWFHRLLAGVVGLLILSMTVWSFKYRKQSKAVVIFSFICLCALISQVFLGMVTINYSNLHWTVAIHLGNAMVLFALLIVTRKRISIAASNENEKIAISKKSKVTLWILLISTFLTMIIGAMVSTSFSGGVCGGLPFCNGEIMPTGDLGAMLHMKHRFMALFVILLTLLFVFFSRKEHATYQKTAKGLFIIVLGQVIIGITVLYSFAHYAWGYQALSIFHLAWGTLIIMALSGALAKIYLGTGGTFHK